MLIVIGVVERERHRPGAKRTRQRAENKRHRPGAERTRQRVERESKRTETGGASQLSVNVNC